MSRLLAYVRPHSWLLVLSLLLVTVVGVLEAASPFLIGLIFDTMLQGAAVPTVAIPLIGNEIQLAETDGAWFLLLLIAATIIKAAAEYGAVTATAYLGQSVVRDLRNDLFEHIIVQPLQFFHNNPTGELISRVSADVERIQVAVSETLGEFLKQAAILIFLLLLVFGIDWKLAASALALVPLVYYPTVWVGRRLRQLGRLNQQEMAVMANVLQESFAGNRIVKAFTMEAAEATKFRRITGRVFRFNLRQKMLHSISSPLMEVVGVLVIAGFLIYARGQIDGQQLTGGLFIAFIIGLIKLYDPVRRISGIHNVFQQALGASSRVFEILEFDGERDDGSEPLRAFEDEIRFDDVRFAYNPGELVLHGIDLVVRRGEVVAIVGPSGAGKSTLVNLLPRFHDVCGGAIRIDGRDIRQFQMQSLRRLISIVTQDVILFNDTIRANIAYGDPSAGEAAILQAARAARVDEFVATLPDGYDTMIGERGLRLSGGERQRISIARALLKNAPILILDEATSSLDAESEILVQQALQNLMEGRTTIVIAHRLSTVRRADRIVVLESGRIREEGTHSELIDHRGLYWRFVHLQEIPLLS